MVEGEITESFSNIKLSERYLDQQTVEDQLNNKKVLSITEVYAVVHPPNFEPPPFPSYVVMGIVARKGEVKQNKLKNKYVMLTLTDLKYDIALAVHGDAFDRYWNVRLGCLVAVLNPSFYESTQANDNGVSTKVVGMSITSGSDVILELGRSKDIGQCGATTSKGKRCSQWINSAKTSYCEFHIELGVRRTGSGRMEFNSVQKQTTFSQEEWSEIAIFRRACCV